MSEDSNRLYPVTYVRHYDRYRKSLYDVDGYLLQGEHGDALHVWKEEFKDMLVAKKIRFIHYMASEPTYCYFIQSQEQAERFQQEREEGSRFPYKRYHIYPDEKLEEVAHGMGVPSSR